jgi:hypothetical protein
MEYMSSSLRGISACIEPSSNGSIIMCVTGGLKDGPVRDVSVRLEYVVRSSITRVEALPFSRRGVMQVALTARNEMLCYWRWF